MSSAAPIPYRPGADSRREEWVREVFAAAEVLRRSGQHKLLRDVTIVLPIDHRAVEAIDLACHTLAEGELSRVSSDLDRFFDRLAVEPEVGDRFVQSVRSVLRRLSPEEFAT